MTVTSCVRYSIVFFYANLILLNHDDNHSTLGQTCSYVLKGGKIIFLGNIFYFIICSKQTSLGTTQFGCHKKYLGGTGPECPPGGYGPALGYAPCILGHGA